MAHWQPVRRTENKFNPSGRLPQRLRPQTGLESPVGTNNAVVGRAARADMAPDPQRPLGRMAGSGLPITFN